MLAAFAHLNWFAVALAGLAYYLLGAVWFTPFFGKAWDHSIGYDRSEAARFGPDYYIVPLASAVVVAIALGLILSALAPSTVWDGMSVGAVIGLGIAGAVSVNNALTPHTPHPYDFGAVTGGYHFVGIVIVSAIIGIFPK